MMWNSGYGMGWGMWVAMGAGTLAFWAVVLILVRSLLPGRGTRGETAPVRPAPLTLLQEGLARGEVTPEEYEQRRRLITDGH